MWYTRLLLVAITSATATSHGTERNESQCIATTGKSRKTHLSISLRKNEGGEWDTLFSAERNSSLLSDIIDVDLTKDVTECSEHRIVSIRGEIKGRSHSPARPRMLFHKKCSPNAAITRGGRSLQKYSSSEAATAFTERPLEDDEVFRVRLDRKSGSYPVLIGVTSHPPGSIEIPNHYYNVNSGSWLYIYADLYINGSIAHQGYAEENLRDAKAGDVLGVMRSKYGSLHFFVNGVDKGPAAAVPENVY